MTASPLELSTCAAPGLLRRTGKSEPLLRTSTGRRTPSHSASRPCPRTSSPRCTPRMDARLPRTGTTSHTFCCTTMTEVRSPPLAGFEICSAPPSSVPLRRRSVYRADLTQVVEVRVGICDEGLAGEVVEFIEVGGTDASTSVGYGSGGRDAQCHSLSKSATPSTRSWRVAICQPSELRTTTSW
jgi:hypothetical protein